MNFLIGLRSDTDGIIGLGQAGLEVTDDHAEKSGREQTRPERTRRVLTNGRQLSQGRLDRCRHMIKLPSGPHR